MDIGNAIVVFRKLKGVKQIELAKRSKLSQTYLSQVENNQRDITFKTLNKISAALDVPAPILVFYSMDKSDIPSNKKASFQVVEPIIKSMLEQFVK